MGFLDGLKNKITESGYADKVSAGLNKIGEGLQSGSEKLQSFASSLNDSNQQVIESDIEITDTQTPVVRENTTMPVRANMEDSVSQVRNNDFLQSVSSINQREMFSVNENDSNETRQIKEVFQDANAVVQSVNEVVNSEAVVNFSVAAREIAIGMKEYKQREQLIEAELSRITLQNQHNLDVMKLTYEHYRPLLDEMTKQLQSSRKTLEKFDIKNLSEEDRKTYNGLLSFISNHTSKIMSLYDKISG